MEKPEMSFTVECVGDTLFNGAEGKAKYLEINEVLYQNLHNIVKGDGETFVTAHEVDRAGLDLYRELAAWFDPTTAEDQSVEHARVTRPD